MLLSIASGVAADRYGTAKGARVLREAGFEAVDYGGACSAYRPFAGLYADTDAAFYAFFEGERRAYEDAGLAIGQMHCPYNAPPDRIGEEEFVFFCKAVQRSVRAAAAVGAPIAVIHPYIPPDWAQEPQKSFDITRRLCAACAEIGAQVGVQVALENMPGDDTTVPFSSAPPFLRLFEELDTPTLGACLDSGHANWALAQPADIGPMAAALGQRLLCVHLHDNGGTWDNHFIPFGGTADWAGLCAALGHSGYRGNINLETGAMRAASDEVFRQGLAFQCAVAAQLREMVLAAGKETAQ